MKIKILFKVKNNKIKKLKKKKKFLKNFNYTNIKTNNIFYKAGPPILANLQVI